MRRQGPYLSAWVRHFAGYYLDSSNGYNAVKHRLSGVPRHGRVSFYTDPETTGSPPVEVPMMAGAMLETLETHERGHRAEIDTALDSMARPQEWTRRPRRGRGGDRSSGGSRRDLDQSRRMQPRQTRRRVSFRPWLLAVGGKIV